MRGKRRGEITEGVFAHGVDNIERSAVRGKNDQAAVRTDAPNFAQQCDVFVASRFFAGDDQVVGTGGDEFEGGGVGWCALDGPGLGVEGLGELGVDFRVAFDVEGGFVRGGIGVGGGHFRERSMGRL